MPPTPTSNTLDQLATVRGAFKPDDVLRGLSLSRAKISTSAIDALYIYFYYTADLMNFYIWDTFNNDIQRVLFI